MDSNQAVQDYRACIAKVRTQEDHKKCMELREKATKDMTQAISEGQETE